MLWPCLKSQQILTIRKRYKKPWGTSWPTLLFFVYLCVLGFSFFFFFTVGLVYSNQALIRLNSVHFGVGQGTVATHGFQMS